MNKNRLARWVVLALGIGSLALSMLVGSAARVGAAQGATDVNVVNSPLSVTGSVSASGTVTANQGGTWTVGLAGTPAVNVKLATRFRLRVDPYDNSGTPNNVWTNNTLETYVIDQAATFNCQESLLYFTVHTSDAGDVAFAFNVNQTSDAAHGRVDFYMQPGDSITNPVGCPVVISGHLEP